MQLDKIFENNKVNISGIVVEECSFSHKVYGEGFYTFKVMSERLSDNKDIIPIMISDRLIDKTEIIKGNKIEIVGQLRSYNNYVNKKSKLVLNVFVREINIVDNFNQKNYNNIFINGFVCKKPIYRETPFGREITDILVAVNRAYNKSDYIPCIVWGRNAKFSAKLDVGSNIKIWGRIQSRIYQKKIDNEIEQRIAYEVSISKIDNIIN